MKLKKKRGTNNVAQCLGEPQSMKRLQPFIEADTVKYEMVTFARRCCRPQLIHYAGIDYTRQIPAHGVILYATPLKGTHPNSTTLNRTKNGGRVCTLV